MLAITQDATDAIREIATANEVPDEGGLRISVVPTEDASGAAVGLSLVAEPGPDDQVVGEEGAQVFVAPELAPELDDKRLDARVDGEDVAFAFEDQS